MRTTSHCPPISRLLSRSSSSHSDTRTRPETYLVEQTGRRYPSVTLGARFFSRVQRGRIQGNSTDINTTSLSRWQRTDEKSTPLGLMYYWCLSASSSLSCRVVASRAKFQPIQYQAWCLRRGKPRNQPGMDIPSNLKQLFSKHHQCFFLT